MKIREILQVKPSCRQVGTKGHENGHSCPVSKYGINSSRNPEFLNKELDSRSKDCGNDNQTFSEQRYNRIAVCVVIILIVLLTAATFQRNRVWETKLSLWEDAAKKSPMKSRVHNNLGNCYMLLDRHFDAIGEYKKAIALDKNNIEAYYNLGMSLDNIGLLNQAVYYYDIFYKIAPAQYDKQKEIARERIDSINNEKFMPTSRHNGA